MKLWPIFKRSSLRAPEARKNSETPLKQDNDRTKKSKDTSKDGNISVFDFVTALAKSKNGPNDDQDASDEDETPSNILQELESGSESEEKKPKNAEPQEPVKQLPKTHLRLPEGPHASSTPIRKPMLPSEPEKVENSPTKRKRRYKRFVQTDRKLIINPSSESEMEDSPDKPAVPANASAATRNQVEELSGAQEAYNEAEQEIVRDLIQQEEKLRSDSKRNESSAEDVTQVSGNILPEKSLSDEDPIKKRRRLNKKRKAEKRKRIRDIRNGKDRKSELFVPLGAHGKPEAETPPQAPVTLSSDQDKGKPEVEVPKSPVIEVQQSQNDSLAPASEIPDHQPENASSNTFAGYQSTDSEEVQTAQSSFEGPAKLLSTPQKGPKSPFKKRPETLLASINYKIKAEPEWEKREQISKRIAIETLTNPSPQPKRQNVPKSDGVVVNSSSPQEITLEEAVVIETPPGSQKEKTNKDIPQQQQMRKHTIPSLPRESEQKAPANKVLERALVLRKPPGSKSLQYVLVSSESSSSQGRLKSQDGQKPLLANQMSSQKLFVSEQSGDEAGNESPAVKDTPEILRADPVSIKQEPRSLVPIRGLNQNSSGSPKASDLRFLTNEQLRSKYGRDGPIAPAAPPKKRRKIFLIPMPEEAKEDTSEPRPMSLEEQLRERFLAAGRKFNGFKSPSPL